MNWFDLKCFVLLTVYSVYKISQMDLIVWKNFITYFFSFYCSHSSIFNECFGKEGIPQGIVNNLFTFFLLSSTPQTVWCRLTGLSRAHSTTMSTLLAYIRLYNDPIESTALFWGWFPPPHLFRGFRGWVHPFRSAWLDFGESSKIGWCSNKLLYFKCFKSFGNW